MDLQKICDDVEREWQMGGLSDGLYGDYAKEVARRAVAAEREACREVVEECIRTQAHLASNAREALSEASARIYKRSNALGQAGRESD